MRLCSLKGNLNKEFALLLPAMYREELKKPETFCLGAYGEKDQAAGVLSFTLKEGRDGIRSELGWIYVTTSCRGQGIGTALLREWIRISRRSGIPEMTCRTDSSTADLDRLLKSCGFLPRRSEELHIRLPFFELLMRDDFRDGQYADGCCCIRDLHEKTRNGLVECIRQRGKLYKADLDYDPDYSFFFKDKETGHLQAILLARKNSCREIALLYLDGNGKEGARAAYEILKRLSLLAGSSCPSDAVLDITCRNENIRKAFEDLAPEYTAEPIITWSFRLCSLDQAG